MNVRLSHLRITASAGTGKTFRLTDRIVELVLLGVEPRKILALTFTRKAAGEFLRKLLEKLAVERSLVVVFIKLSTLGIVILILPHQLPI